MSAEDSSKHTGLYERTVQKITEWVKPSLHDVTQKFVDKSVDKYAKDNSKFARIIEFEVRRRGDGAGLTQDVAEPLLWTGIKTASAIAIAAFTHRLKNKEFKLVGDVTVIGLLLNNAVELFRLVPRYKAGLQGSLEMAKDRWQSIGQSGIDPFSSQTREINPDLAALKHAHTQQALSWQKRVSDVDIASGNDKSPRHIG
jgi:hypothetical protein